MIVHAPPPCERRRGALSEAVAADLLRVVRHQVFKWPPLALDVVEHGVDSRRCRCCGAVCRGSFPAALPQPVHQGGGVRALRVDLQAYPFIPCARTCERRENLFGAPLSEGTLSEAIRADAHRAATETAIREALSQARVVPFDEAGLRIEKKLQRRRSASTATLTCCSPQKKRGQQGRAQAGVLPHFRGRAVHDGGACYFLQGCPRALCKQRLIGES